MLEDFKKQGICYVVCDALTKEDLAIVAQASQEKMRLFTGSSGFAEALEACWNNAKTFNAFKPNFSNGKTVVLCGSCSVATQAQLAHYRRLQAPCLKVKVDDCLHNPIYARVKDDQ